MHVLGLDVEDALLHVERAGDLHGLLDQLLAGAVGELVERRQRLLAVRQPDAVDTGEACRGSLRERAMRLGDSPLMLHSGPPMMVHEAHWPQPIIPCSWAFLRG